MKKTYVLVVLIVVQLLCALFFVGNILTSVLGFAPISWQISEYIEIGAALGLLLGIVVGAITLRRTLARNAQLDGQLRMVSGAFTDLMYERFAEWGLTPAEQDVALFAIKGMSISDIAALRSTSEGTVKAQTNAIYRKAGVSGRPQLLSLFIEDLLDDTLSPSTLAEPAAVSGVGFAGLRRRAD
ncbi:helix-turn-helix transcriptional regulator [Loktanella sp. IMCC34160]|uniref:helix-turn-helix transcriptional regulator n=1 Tax=Loktanella sp. IMCC34160 TaxID=2510646 RepID=UPI00101B6775|nr:LuxR C-terminal-related transcriptional regulator [Loktanella sp. IMCC34160]RYG90633.1 helix-turn-helix transcriptional regulator [Loktanella sp. IMCC34160]